MLFAYSRGITSSRTMARACGENVVFIALAAWLGLVPAQHSSGGHTRLGEINCRGDAYLRTLLIQGARSSLQRAKAVAIEGGAVRHRGR